MGGGGASERQREGESKQERERGSAQKRERERKAVPTRESESGQAREREKERGREREGAGEKARNEVMVSQTIQTPNPRPSGRTSFSFIRWQRILLHNCFLLVVLKHSCSKIHYEQVNEK